MKDISSFIKKHRNEPKEATIEEKIDKLPWHMKPIEKTAFKHRKAKDGQYYVRHNEWSDKVWIGPYKSITDVHKVIKSYIELSKEEPLNRITATNDLHSVYVEDMKKFF